MFHNWRTAPGFGGWKDILINIAIYVPVGLLAGLKLRRRSLLTRIAVPLVTGAAVSLAVEVVQVYDVSRYPSALDWVTNVLGTMLGLAAALVLPRVFVGPVEWLGTRVRRSPAAAVLCAIWLAYWTFPWVPYLSPYGWTGKLKDFVSSPWPFLVLCSSTAAYLSFGMLLRAVSATHVVPAMMLAVLIVPAQVALLGRHPALVDLAGAVAGSCLFLAVRNHPRRVRLTAIVFCSTLVLRGLSPFTPTMSPKPLEWIPLVASLSTERPQAVLILIEKFAWYGTAVWMLRLAGMRLIWSALSVAAVLFGIEIAQQWLPGRTPETSDPVIAIAMSGVLAIAERRRDTSLPVRQR